MFTIIYWRLLVLSGLGHLVIIQVGQQSLYNCYCSGLSLAVLYLVITFVTRPINNARFGDFQKLSLYVFVFWTVQLTCS